MGRTIKIGAGIQSPSPVTLNGELQGQVIINTNNATQVWSGATTINGMTISPDANFEFSQTSADLGGGAIGMIPLRLWKSDSRPGLDANGRRLPVVAGEFFQSGAVPVIIRHYGPTC